MSQTSSEFQTMTDQAIWTGVCMEFHLHEGKESKKPFKRHTKHKIMTETCRGI